uniref:Nudix hydrolase domain-containing protein n=1 Tax=viral metagenome TaxID=1070528 RepID=A0A6C0JAG2_9ZZZZ
MGKYHSYRFIDEFGNSLAASGLIFYNEHGVWIIKEKTSKNSFEYNDPGGKYEGDKKKLIYDRNIYECAVREFSEETYDSVNFNLNKLYKLLDENKVIKTYPLVDKNKKPNYLSLLIHLNDTDVTFSNDAFHKNLEHTLKHKPNVNCSSIDLIFLKYSDYEDTKSMFSFRLRQIFEKTDVLRGFTNKYDKWTKLGDSRTKN